MSMTEDPILTNAAKLIESNSPNCQSLQSFFWKSELYTIGDFVKVTLKRQVRKHQPFVAKLLSAYLLKDFPDVGISFPLVRLQYFFDRHCLSDSHKAFKNHLSENELFCSDICAYVPLNLLSGKAKVVSMEEYFENPDELTLKFSQAQYDTHRDKITPPLQSRQRLCVCQTIENPDFNYILCEGCKNWFHYHCVGISPNSNDLTTSFFCKSCRE